MVIILLGIILLAGISNAIGWMTAAKWRAAYYAEISK